MKRHSLGETDDNNLFRLVDMNGDWTHYFHKPTGRTLKSSTYILNRGFAKGPQFLEALKNSSAEAWDKKTSDACDRGDAVHQGVRGLIISGSFSRLDEVLSEDNKTPRRATHGESDAIMSFGRLWNDHGMVAIGFEKSIVNLDGDGYAGTLDLLAVMTKPCGRDKRYCKCVPFMGKLGLWDHKSGKGIYESYGPQVASYAKADLKEIIGTRKVEYTAIDHLGRDTERGYKIEFYDEAETEKHWNEFQAANVIMNATYKPYDFLADDEEIEEEIKIERFVEVLKSEPLPVEDGNKKVA